MNGSTKHRWARAEGVFHAVYEADGLYVRTLCCKIMKAELITKAKEGIVTRPRCTLCHSRAINIARGER